MTITLTDSVRRGDGTSLDAALARVASARRGAGANPAYGSVTIGMTLRNGRVRDVVAA